LAPEEAGSVAAPGHHLIAIWPSPVNHDACFEQAGFTEFGDNDEEWDAQAEELLRRVIAQLSRFGSPVLLSKPLPMRRPWYQVFKSSPPQPLLQQALLPMHWDSLPSFRAVFSPSTAELRTGSGHFLLWVSVPTALLAEPRAFVAEVAAPWPIQQTQLRWHTLLPSAA
jgi:hypothetical protein